MPTSAPTFLGLNNSTSTENTASTVTKGGAGSIATENIRRVMPRTQTRPRASMARLVSRRVSMRTANMITSVTVPVQRSRESSDMQESSGELF